MSKFQLGKILLMGLFIVMMLGETEAQTTFQPKQIEYDWKGIVYRHERAFDISLHTHGIMLGYNSGRILTYDKTRFYHFSIGYMRDPREKRQNKNIPFGGMTSKSFSYGKRNSMYVLRAGYGRKKYLSEKAKRKGIALGYSYEVGPSIAVLKPNYLKLVVTENQDGVLVDEIRTEKYSDETAEVFLDYNRIFGGEGFGSGWGEVTFTPGIQARGGLIFSLGAYDKYVKMIEVGVMADMYIKKIPILVETEAVSNKPYFINLYVTLQFGARSN